MSTPTFHNTYSIFLLSRTYQSTMDGLSSQAHLMCTSCGYLAEWWDVSDGDFDVENSMCEECLEVKEFPQFVKSATSAASVMCGGGGGCGALQELQEEEEEEQIVLVKPFSHDGVDYLKSSDGILYNPTSYDEVGVWNEETQTITPIEDDESEEEEDDE